MKILSILFLFLASFIFCEAKGRCDNLLGYHKSEKPFVQKIRKILRNKDSAFIYFRKSHNVNFGIAAYQHQGQIITFQVTEINGKIKTDSLPKEGISIINAFFKNEIYNDTTSMPQPYYVDDGGYSNILFQTKSLCWLYQIPGMTKKVKREEWVAELYIFTWGITENLNPLK
jgi:hypothetical protein